MQKYNLDNGVIDTLKTCLNEVMIGYNYRPVKVGQRLFICCPFHNEKTPSCSVDLDKGLFNCFGCGKSGDALTFVALMEGLNLNDAEQFQQTAKIVADLGGVNLMPSNNPSYPSYPSLPNHHQIKSRPTPPTEPSQPPVYIDIAEVRTASALVERSTLFKFLCGVYSLNAVRRAFDLYLVGSTAEFGNVPGYASAFPYIDMEGNCVDIHLMKYETDGHRSKGGYSQNWLIAKKGKSDRRGKWPLFGEHLLPLDPTAPVGIVESEKTALIGTIAMPGYIWVATGSVANLNAKRLNAVKDRDCYLFPDLDGLPLWEEKANRLADEGFNVTFCGDFIRDNATSPKDDLADILINHALKASTDETK